MLLKNTHQSLCVVIISLAFYFTDTISKSANNKTKIRKSNLKLIKAKSQVQLLQYGKTLAHLKFSNNKKNLLNCTLYDLESELTLPNDGTIQPTDFETIMKAIGKCSRLTKIQMTKSGRLPTLNRSENETIDALTANLKLWRNGILPGTNWCGIGHRARHFGDLGNATDIDICCRAHDYCPIRLAPFQRGYGLFNFSIYTRLHCDCDENFYKCLKQFPKSQNAKFLGQFYFDYFKAQCIRYNATMVQ